MTAVTEMPWQLPVLAAAARVDYGVDFDDGVASSRSQGERTDNCVSSSVFHFAQKMGASFKLRSVFSRDRKT